MSKRKPHPTRVFNTPEKLLKAWREYKKELEIKSSEWIEVKYVGKDAERVEEPKKLPMLRQGFFRFCRENYGHVHQYFENKDSLYQDFVEVCNDIITEIEENQITGAYIGFFNAGLVSRVNKISEHQKIESTGEIILNVPKESEGLGEA